MDPQRPTPGMLVAAYSRGIFPMVDTASGRIDWYSPDPRGVIPMAEFHVSKSLARVVRSDRFEIRTDTRFEEVMRHCADSRPGREGTWIDDRLVAAYAGLHAEGGAHSIEAWRDDELVGGLYGVHLGAAFFGESMFSLPERGGTDASKVCLVRLVELLRTRAFTLLDTQFWNEHLDQFGCIEIPRDQYLKELAAALSREVPWPAPGGLALPSS